MDIAILVIICTIVVQFDVTGISGLARHEFVTDIWHMLFGSDCRLYWSQVISISVLSA